MPTHSGKLFLNLRIDERVSITANILLLKVAVDSTTKNFIVLQIPGQQLSNLSGSLPRPPADQSSSKN